MNKRLSEADAEKVCISMFDESDPAQHTMKILFGSGIYFEFRGRLDHNALEVDHIGQGVFEEGHLYAGKQFISIRVVNDKTNKK